MTAYALKGDRENFMDAGMDDYITKPIDKNLFYRVVKKMTWYYNDNMEKEENNLEDNAVEFNYINDNEFKNILTDYYNLKKEKEIGNSMH